MGSDTNQLANTARNWQLSWWSLAVALLVLVVIEGILWTITRIFILNFDVAGPNATAVLFALLATGWVLAALSRHPLQNTAIYAWSGVVLGCGFLLSLVSSPFLAGIGAVIMVTGATVPLVGMFDAVRERIVTGVALGVLLVAGLRALLDTASPYATSTGTALLTAAVAILVGILLTLGYRQQTPETIWTEIGARPAVLLTLLVVAAGFLIHPQAIARWALRSYEFAVLALVIGVLSALFVLHVWGIPTRTEAIAWVVLYLASISAILYLSHEVTTIAYAIAWASALLLLAASARPFAGTEATRSSKQATGDGQPKGDEVDRSTGGGTGALPATGFQFLTLFLLFLTVSATHWAFMPFPLDLLEGLGTPLTLLTLAVFPAAVLYALSGDDKTTAIEDTPAVAQSRRSAVGAIGAGLLPIGGLLANRTDPGVPRQNDGRIRVMAYNLHIFFEERESGQYSLEAIRDVIAEDGADIIAVSESDGLRPLPGYVDGLQWLGNELGYYTEFGGATRMRSYGVGFLSRWPIEDVEVIELPIGRSLTRLAVTAVVQTPQGPLPVLSTHFMVEKENPADDTREEQAQTVVDEMTQYDQAVVMGDFNSRPDESEYEILDDAFTDAWVVAREQNRTSGTDETFSAGDPNRRIDYIFLQGEWTIHEAATTGTARASDHKAVVAELEPDQPLELE